MAKRPNTPESTLWEFILYPDSEAYDFELMLEAIKADAPIWAYALHDHDITDDGDFKKAHIHIMCRYPGSARTLTSFQNKFPELGNNIEKGKTSFKAMVRYLVHADSRGKHKYNPADIVSNFDIDKFFPPDENQVLIDQLFEYILIERPSLAQLYAYAGQIGAQSQMRSNWFMLRDILNDERKR